MKMLLVGGNKYNLADINDREKLHKWVDQWVEENFEDLLMNGELEPEVAQVHELISEEDSVALHGMWFNGNLQITHWYEPITDYLDEMDISYTVLHNGDVDMYLKGEHIIFTREEVHNKDKNNTYVVCEDGIIRKEVLEKFGLYYVKDYYLPRVS